MAKSPGTPISMDYQISCFIPHNHSIFKRLKNESKISPEIPKSEKVHLEIPKEVENKRTITIFLWAFAYFGFSIGTPL